MLKIDSTALRAAAISSLALLTVACQAGTTKSEAQPVAPAVVFNNDDYYEVHHEGRIYAFDDAATYRSFLEVGETSYRKVRIGEGPKGETVVFGLRGEDKKKLDGIAVVEMYDGKLAGAEGFYGEMRVDGRIYVFDDWQELVAFRQVGEAPYRFTQIGAGPAGETVVFVLTKDNKKKRPDALIEAFTRANS